MIDVRSLEQSARRKLQQRYGLSAVEEPNMSEVQQETAQTRKTKSDPALQVLETIGTALGGMEQAAQQMAQASVYVPREYTYWGLAKRTLQVCSVAVPIAMLALAGTLWSMRRVV